MVDDFIFRFVFAVEGDSVEFEAGNEFVLGFVGVFVVYEEDVIEFEVYSAVDIGVVVVGCCGLKSTMTPSNFPSSSPNSDRRCLELM